MPILLPLNLVPRGGIPPLAPPGSPTGLIKRDPWQTVLLGGVALPGAWRVVLGQVCLKRDPKPKAGADGANPAYHGIDLGRFEVEGEQQTDDERSALFSFCSGKLPQPGQAATQIPMLLQHPSVAIFGFPIFVKIVGGSILEVVRVGVTKMRIYVDHWLRPKKGDASATQIYTRGTSNALRDKREAKEKSNPSPTEQPGLISPPASFTPAQ